VTKENLIFPVPLVTHVDENFSKYKEELTAWVYKERDRVPSDPHSNIEGYQSAKGLYKRPDFAEFTKHFGAVFGPVLSKYFCTRYTFECSYDLTNCWFNINYPGAFNLLHCHPGVDLVCVFWLKAPKNSGNLGLQNPHVFTCNNMVEGEMYTVEPYEGEFVFFPASILHLVSQNKSTEDRISFAFNFKQRLDYG